MSSLDTETSRQEAVSSGKYIYYPDDMIALSKEDDPDKQFVADYRNPYSIIYIPIYKTIDWDAEEIAYTKYHPIPTETPTIEISIRRSYRKKKHTWEISLRIINNTYGWWEGDFPIPDAAMQKIKDRYERYHQKTHL